LEYFRENLKSRIEYGTLLATGKPPWWFRFSIFLQQQWSNPIFQRNYMRRQVGMVKNPERFVMIAVGGSYILSVVLLASVYFFKLPWDDALSFAIVGGVFVVPGVLYIYLLVKLFIACLMTTSATMRANLGSETPDAVMSTPVTDRDLFYGETLPSFVGGVDLALLFGAINYAIALPIALVFCAAFIVFEWQVPYMLWIIPVSLTGFALYTTFLIGNVMLMMLLLSYAVGRWIFGYSVFGAIVLALLHYWWIQFLSGIIPLGFGSLAILGLPLKYGIIILGIILTSRSGITVLGKFRRQGNFFAGLGRRPEPVASPVVQERL